MKALSTGTVISLDRIYPMEDVLWIVLGPHSANPRLCLLAPFLLHPNPSIKQGHFVVAPDGSRMPLFPQVIMCIHNHDVLPEDIQDQSFEAEFSDGSRQYKLRHSLDDNNGTLDENILSTLSLAREKIERRLQLNGEGADNEDVPALSECELSAQDFQPDSLRFQWSLDPLRSYELRLGEAGSLTIRQDYQTPDRTDSDVMTPLRIGSQTILFRSGGISEIGTELARSIENEFARLGQVTGSHAESNSNGDSKRTHWPSWAFPVVLAAACAALVTVSVLIDTGPGDESKYSVLAFSTESTPNVLPDGIRGAEGAPDEVLYLRLASENARGTATMLQAEMSSLNATVSQMGLGAARIKLIAALPTDQEDRGKIFDLFDLETQPPGLLVIDIHKQDE